MPHTDVMEREVNVNESTLVGWVPNRGRDIGSSRNILLIAQWPGKSKLLCDENVYGKDHRTRPR